MAALAAAVLSSQGQTSIAPAETEPAGEMQQKQQEYTRIQTEISTVQQQAQTSEAVQTTMKEFRETVSGEMIRQAPEMRADVERQTKLVEELTTDEQDDAARKEKLAEFQALRGRLVPIERRVQEAEKVVQAREAYTSALMAEMQKIDPEIQNKLQRHSELSAELQQTAASPKG
ncbi:MAG: hypothetical protein ACREIA_11950 [Opitutaceae bacterium]